MSVVLPAPSGPTKAVSVPCSTSSDTPSSACTTSSPPSRRNVFLISRPLRTFVCSARFIVGPLDVDKETRRHGHKETLKLRDDETRRLGDEETRSSSRDYPLRFIDHRDEHPENFVVHLIQRYGLICFSVSRTSEQIHSTLAFRPPRFQQPTIARRLPLRSGAFAKLQPDLRTPIVKSGEPGQ